MDSKIQKIEDERLVEFDGEISEKLIDRKIAVLEKKTEDMSKEISRLKELRTRTKYGKMTVEQVADKWKCFKHDRIHMLYELPGVRDEIGNIAHARDETVYMLQDRLEDGSWEDAREYGVRLDEIFGRFCK